MSDNLIWLVGAGPMAAAYAKVLKAQSVDFEVIGRGPESAAAFEKETGTPVNQGGIEKWLKARGERAAAAIVATGVEQLAANTTALLNAGVGKILVEKPAGLTPEEVAGVAVAAAKKDGAKVRVAYNRRFYASVTTARRFIEEDGGATSMFFEFTEWSHKIEPLVKAPGVKENWFYANSTHVVDTAFFLAGGPLRLISQSEGGLPWHPAASRFSGSGVTEKGVLFAYVADWTAPGRWGVEVMTRRHRLILRPMEQLFVQKIGSVAVEPVEIDDTMDKDYKPGLYEQVRVFLEDPDHRDLLSVAAQADKMKKIYLPMLEGN